MATPNNSEVFVKRGSLWQFTESNVRGAVDEPPFDPRPHDNPLVIFASVCLETVGRNEEFVQLDSLEEEKDHLLALPKPGHRYLTKNGKPAFDSRYDMGTQLEKARKKKAHKDKRERAQIHRLVQRDLASIAKKSSPTRLQSGGDDPNKTLAKPMSKPKQTPRPRLKLTCTKACQVAAKVAETKASQAHPEGQVQDGGHLPQQADGPFAGTRSHTGHACRRLGKYNQE